MKNLQHKRCGHIYICMGKFCRQNTVHLNRNLCDQGFREGSVPHQIHVWALNMWTWALSQNCFIHRFTIDFFACKIGPKFRLCDCALILQNCCSTKCNYINSANIFHIAQENNNFYCTMGTICLVVVVLNADWSIQCSSCANIHNIIIITAVRQIIYCLSLRSTHTNNNQKLLLLHYLKCTCILVFWSVCLKANLLTAEIIMCFITFSGGFFLVLNRRYHTYIKKNITNINLVFSTWSTLLLNFHGEKQKF